MLHEVIWLNYFLNQNGSCLIHSKIHTKYSNFVDSQLKHKAERETKTWKMIQDNRRKFTKELLINIFDIVDMEGLKTRWFGSLLATPNTNLIVQSPIKDIIEWIELLCFSELLVENIF